MVVVANISLVDQCKFIRPVCSSCGVIVEVKVVLVGLVVGLNGLCVKKEERI